jgi:hypothetical protein
MSRNLSPQRMLKPVEWSAQRLAAYAEAGNMLRHYSSSRTAVISIALPVCLGMLVGVLSLGQLKRVAVYLLAAEAMLFLYSAVLSIFFSMQYEQLRRLLLRIEAGEDVFVYNGMASFRLKKTIYLDGIDKSFILIGTFLHGAYYVYYFA